MQPSTSRRPPLGHPAMRTFLGVPVFVGGRPFGNLVAAHSNEMDFMARVLRGETIQHHETSRVCKDGTQVAVSLSAAATRDRYGKVTGIACRHRIAKASDFNSGLSQGR
jgi:hypothetical protein